MGLSFGRKYSDAPPATSGSGKWIKALKEGETRIRFLQEVKDWTVYYEHYNPSGSAFPCTGDRQTCPGCTSSNERMKQASRKNAVNALVNGYVDVYKLPVKLTNRLVIRSERNGGTITDRDYLLTRVGKDKDSEYDLEALGARPLDQTYELADIESMLAEQFKENWPDFEVDSTGETKSQERDEPLPGRDPEATPADDPSTWSTPGVTGSAEKPPFEEQASTPDSGEDEVEVTEEQLRAMSKPELVELMKREEIEYGPTLEDDSVDTIVDWLLEHA